MNKKFLKKYLNSTAPTGFEVELGGQVTWIDYVKKYAKEVTVDNYGTAVATFGSLESDYTVVIEAHADEISWFVNYITPEGYIKVIRNGGSDALIAPSMRVNLWGNKGCVTGVFGYPPIHDRERNEKADLKSVFIDIGASSKEDVLEAGIEVGTVITFKDEFMKLGTDYFTGRALDNRIGGFAIAEVLRKLHEEDIQLDYKLCVVNAVQEEVGLRGAEMIVNKIKPDVAIVTDVCHETTSPAYDRTRQGEFIAGQGAVIPMGPAIQHNLLKKVKSVAEKNDIKTQLAAVSSQTGTDADAFAFNGEGVATVLIKFPLKYMHTTVETVHKKDVKAVINLIYSTLLEIKEGEDFRYYKK